MIYPHDLLPDSPSPEFCREAADDTDDAWQTFGTDGLPSFDRAAWARAETIARNEPRCPVCLFPPGEVTLETSLMSLCKFAQTKDGLWRHA